MRTLNPQEMDQVSGGTFLCFVPKLLSAITSMCQPKEPKCEPAPQPEPCEPKPRDCQPKHKRHC